MSNISSGIIPFTELVERMALLAGDVSYTSEPKFKGLVNDCYTKAIPRIMDWDFLRKSTAITCVADYSTGTASATAGSTSITGTGTTWTSTMTSTNGYKIKFSSHNVIYDFTYASATTATISPALSGGNNITNGGYTIFRDTYSLASDFGRFLLGEEGGLKVMRSGKWDIAGLVSDREWRDNYNSTPSDVTRMCKLVGWDSSGYRRVQINPPTDTAIALPYDYIANLTPMTEYTTGYISAITSGATAVTGTDTIWNVTGNIDTSTYNYYFRIDSDGTAENSVWYQVSSVGSATSITLSSNYGGSTITTGNSTNTYTISRVPLLPPEFHDYIIYWGAKEAIADQGDENYQYYLLRAERILDELKTLYKSRRMNAQFGLEDDLRDRPRYA